MCEEYPSMSTQKVYLAADLGAESGRVIAGAFDGSRLSLNVVHRFPNNPVRVLGKLRWDALSLFSEIKCGIARAVKIYGSSIASLGVDTWGVDYGLLDGKGNLLGNPWHYRDARTDGMMDEAFKRVPRAEIYRATGIQFMFFNTLFQLLAEEAGGAQTLGTAHRLLFMPDLFNYWLTGRQANERTISSTSQMCDPTTGNWADGLIERMRLPRRILGEIVAPGTILGRLHEEVGGETGAGAISVVASGCHDTASAVAAVPAVGDDHAYLSSGTWSLMGVETRKPIITDRSYEYGATNEIGVCDTIRVLKNISGLWLVQQCRLTWAAQGEDLAYDELTRLAGQARPFAAFIDPDGPRFASPGDMPARIAEFCRETDQAPPESKGGVVRVALESLAFRYRSVLRMLEELSGKRLAPLHIVGGGTKNRLLNQFAANAVGRTVVAGPVEATSAGNILMQMIGIGDLASLAEGRELVRRSFPRETYEPEDSPAWEQAYRRFQEYEGKAR